MSGKYESIKCEPQIRLSVGTDSGVSVQWGLTHKNTARKLAQRLRCVGKLLQTCGVRMLRREIHSRPIDVILSKSTEVEPYTRMEGLNA